MDHLPWLLLVHQLPAEPSKVRVKTWRRLQGVGAVAVKNSVYVLPNTSETREDFEWIRAEIASQGGEAIVLAAQAVDDLSSSQIRNAVERARQSDWQDLCKQCQEVIASHPSQRNLGDKEKEQLRRQLRTLRGRAARIDKIDHLRVSGRSDAMSALQRLERLIEPQPSPAAEKARRRSVDDYQGRVWLTRPRPGVDRLASAWLIRRFIDRQAAFRFGEELAEQQEAVPFDMFGAEFGHRGERVSFETLLHEFGLSNPALSRIARIVHEVDLRAEAFSDAEAATLDRLIEGLRASYDDDQQLLEQGMALFEALYRSFSSQSG